MHHPPPDLDTARAAAGMGPAFAEAAGLLSGDLYHVVPFQSLAAVKNHLKHFFSREPWSATDEAALGEILMFNVEAADGWWEHDLTGGFRLAHGFREGRYRLWVTGGGGPSAAPSIFDRVFSGPVVPEATPNPRHVRFPIGGNPSPGRWYAPGDQIDDPRVAALMADPEVADVLVAGDFVAIGLRRAARWEQRIDDLLGTVTRLFWDPSRAEDVAAGTIRTPSRDELVAGVARTELHLLDPDDPDGRERLERSATSPDPQERRMALATLAHSRDAGYVRRRLVEAYDDPSRLVRRAVIDAAVDREDEQLRPLFESALADADAWIRWKALRGLRELGAEPSRTAISRLADDADFQVRFEVAAALREA